VNVDVQLEQASAAEARALRPDRGTTVVYPTFHPGAKVTAVRSGIEVEVDGRTAYNWTGWQLSVGDVVLLAVDQRRRMVIGVGTIKSGT
jgi:hypothetical protein